MRCEQPTESLHFPSHSLQSPRHHFSGSIYSGAKHRAHSSFSAGRPEDFQPRFKKQNKPMVCYSHGKGRRIPNLAELLEWKKATFRKTDWRRHSSCHRSLHRTGGEAASRSLPINGNAPENTVKKTDKVLSSQIHPAPLLPFFVTFSSSWLWEIKTSRKLRWKKKLFWTICVISISCSWCQSLDN